jgi:hypothetical protein
MAKLVLRQALELSPSRFGSDICGFLSSADALKVVIGPGGHGVSSRSRIHATLRPVSVGNGVVDRAAGDASNPATAGPTGRPVREHLP